MGEVSLGLVNGSMVRLGESVDFGSLVGRARIEPSSLRRERCRGTHTFELPVVLLLVVKDVTGGGRDRTWRRRDAGIPGRKLRCRKLQWECPSTVDA